MEVVDSQTSYATYLTTMALERKRLLKRMDWYIIGKYMGTFFLCIGLSIAVMVVFDYNEHIERLKDATLKELVFEYYLNFIPFYTNMFSSLFAFLAVIFFTSKMADNSEIIAMFSTGLSFKRMLVPYIISACLISGMSLALSAYFIPKGGVKRVAFENRYTQKSKVKQSVRNMQLEVSDGVIAYIESYQDLNKTAYKFCLDSIDNKRLVSHLTARTAVYDTLRQYHWILKNYTIRNLGNDREVVIQGVELDSLIMMEPSDIMIVRGQQETMTSAELRQFINKQKKRGVGAALREFEIEYHKRFAMAFTSIILTFIGVSLSSRKRKGGMGLHLGIGIGLCFAYILFQEVSSTFAISGSMSAFWAEWLPNLVFVPVAAYLYIKAPK